jgi:hypothetical protein
LSIGVQCQGKENPKSLYFIMRSFISFSLFLTLSSIGLVADDQAIARFVTQEAPLHAGLCIHIGSTANQVLTAELSGSGKIQVQGLYPNAVDAEKARGFIASKKLYGRVSIDYPSLAALPYSDNLVNLIVCNDLDTALKNQLSLQELIRVLRPQGIALLGSAPGSASPVSESSLREKLEAAGIKDFEIIKREGIWAKIRKPLKSLAEWTHNLRFASDGNRCSPEELGPISAPQWLTAASFPLLEKEEHVNLAGGGGRHAGPGLLTCNGRLFYIRAGHITARDAYNGLLLWEHSVNWKKQNNVIFHGAVSTYATPDKVFAPLEDGLTVYDAATGAVAYTYKTTDEVGEVFGDDKNAYLTTVTKKGITGLHALDVASGKLRWKQDLKVRDPVLAGGQIFLLDAKAQPSDLVCLDGASGQAKWRVSTAPWGTKKLSLCFHQDGVLILSEGTEQEECKVHAISANDGNTFGAILITLKRT